MSPPTTSSSAGGSAERLTLLDLMRRRRALDLTEALRLLSPLGEALDLGGELFQNATAPGLREIAVRVPACLALPTSALLDEPLAAWPEFTLEIWVPTGSAVAADRTLANAAAAPSGPVILAALFCELLGGQPPTMRRDGRYVPLGALGESGNDLLREVFATGGARWAVCADLVLAIVRATTSGSAVRLVEEPPLAIPDRFFALRQPGTRLWLRAASLPPGDPGQTEVRLVAGPEFRLGRSPTMSDFVTWFLPRDAASDAKTARLSKVQATLLRRGNQLFIRDGHDEVPSANGTALNDQLLNVVPRALPGAAGELRLSGEYRLVWQRRASTRSEPPSFREGGRHPASAPESETCQGCMLFAAVEQPAPLYEAVWLFSDAAIATGARGPRFGVGGTEIGARFLYHRGSFFLENVAAARGEVGIEGDILGIQEALPLVNGQTLRIGDATFQVEVA